MELTKEIQEALKKHLPQMQADEFKAFIEEANYNKVRVTTLESTLKSKDDQVSKLLANKSEFDKAEAARHDAEVKLQLAEAKERKYDLDIRDQKIENQKFVIDSFKEFLTLLVKNPRAIEMISEHRNIPVFEPYTGGGGCHTTKSEWSSGTREKTEEKR